MKVLMVGSGAVGQVFGLFLANSGVELAFYARPGSADGLREALEHGGLPLFQISYLHRRNPIAHRLKAYQVVTDVAESQRFDPDQIWFAVPSPVYYSEWFRMFLREVPSERVVCFAPEGGRPEIVPEGVPEGRLVFGGITFVAWQGDLEGGGGRSEGVNFWLPPGPGIPLMGAEKACLEVKEVLATAGIRSGVKDPGYRSSQAAATALLSTFVAGIELSGWSLGAFRRGPWLRRAARGSREAVSGQLSSAGGLARRLLGIPLSAAGFYLVTLFLPIFFPFDLEKYLKFHYLKTRPQTLALLELFVSDGSGQGLPVQNIRILLQGLLDSA